MEGVGLVDHRAADAEHVHAGVAQVLERGAIVGGVGVEARQVERRPADAAAEHGDAVDDEAEALAIGVAIDVEGAEADAPEIDADLAVRRMSSDSRTG